MEFGPGEEKYTFQIPVFDDSTSPPKILPGFSNETVDENSVFDLIDRLSQVFPDMPPFEIAKRYLRFPKELCFSGLVDSSTLDLISLEAACKAYHQLPYGGGLQDQPSVILEAFESIREAQADYYRIKFAQDESERQQRKDAPAKR